MNNRWFIGAASSIDNLMGIIVGSKEVQRTSKDGQCIVKLPIGDKNTYEQLNSFRELSYKEAELELQKEVWL